MKNILLLIASVMTPTLFFALSFSLSDSTFRVGDICIINNIFFDFENATLEPDSYQILDSIALFLEKNNEIKVEIGNHCDERFSDEYSTCLTCERAEAIGGYIILKGIKANLIITKGYNDAKPLLKNAKSEAEHQKNRRTEIKTISIGDTGTITKLELHLSAFGVESNDFPSIDAWINFESDSSYCKKWYYHPDKNDSIYSLSDQEIAELHSIISNTNWDLIRKKYKSNATDQPSSTIIILTINGEIRMDDYGLIGEHPIVKI